MNDKPSALPPSLFLRDISEHSLSGGANVDHLMEEYNGGHLRQSVEMRYPPEPYLTHSTLAASRAATRDQDTPDTPGKQSGLFRFGRMVASSFNPANVWSSFSRTFKDTKDEMTVRNIEENRRKAQQKAEAEARYAEMKATGQFARSPFTVLSNAQSSAISPALFETEDDDEQDCAENVVGMDSQPRDSAVTDRGPLQDNPDMPSKAPLKSRKSLFGIRRPSFSNLKRARSDYNLSDLTQAHLSSSSASPEKKAQAPKGLLKKSLSKRDLGKQQKLSKRVSDLETKLAEARLELTTAINNASPLPNLPSPFEKYKPGKHMTPSARFKAKFIPGLLPSLPSERLLFPEASQQESDDHSYQSNAAEIFTPLPRISSLQPPPNPVVPLTDTPLTAIPPAMADSPASVNTEKPLPDPPRHDQDMHDVSDEADNDTIYVASASQSQAGGNYEDLDARLKALDKAVETKGRKKAGGRKRKSTDDKEYRPGAAATDDEDYEPAKKTKKRKSIGRQSSKETSQVPNTRRKSGGRKSLGEEDAGESAPVVTSALTGEPDTGSQVVAEPVSVTSSKRASFESQAALEPISEEETAASAKHDSGISVTATQAKTLRGTTRGSPPPSSSYSQVEQVMEETVSVTPGEDGVPEMPRLTVGTNTVAAHKQQHTAKTKKTTIKKSSSKGVNVSEEFEWPDDVF